MNASRLPVAVATHAARDIIGEAPAVGETWPGLTRLLDWAATTGFDGLDVSTSVFDVDRPTDWWRGVAKQASDRGLKIASINCLRSSLADENYWQAGARRIRRAVEIAEELGIPTVNISLAVPPERLDANSFRQLREPPGSSRGARVKERRATIERLLAIDRDTRHRDTDLVLELHHCSLVDTAPALRSMLDDLGGGYTGNPDVVNELWAFDTIDSTPTQIMDVLAPVSPHLWHLKNYVLEPAEQPRLPPTFVDASLVDGAVDYVDALSRMRSAGFAGWFSIERSGPGDFLKSAEIGLDFLHTSMTPSTSRRTT